ncbi:amidohydrolase family protein [Anaeromicropila populeti]|uniref:Amidohydrolase n=1 Tax=Anaeromicropila populeti TaxID=37658 RepID=A0A1I6HVW2_9FIRM|nr:amidohydrolase family protein [Anaeromicropila populeti]SFR58583.1 Amidohydrolase [Anaeromicropila populeti]
MIDVHYHYHFCGGEIAEDIKKIGQQLEQYQIEKALLHIISEDSMDKKYYTADWGNRIIPSIMVNPFSKNMENDIKNLSEHGIRFVKLLPYEQMIKREHYDKVANLCKCIEQYGMIVVICGSYGSELIYQTNGVELTEYVLRHHIKSPVILAHGGMVKVLDTLSLMMVYDNLYMDIAYTLPFWWGSSVITDYAFVLHKLNYERTFFGSDAPYYSLEEALHYFELFCSTYHIEQSNKEKLMKTNFNLFYEKYVNGVL